MLLLCSLNHSALGGFHTPCSFIHSLWFCRPLVWDSRVALWSACLGSQPHLLWLGSPGENYSLSPLIIFPLPPVGWFPWVWWPPGCLSCPFPLLRFLLPFVGFPFALPSRHCWCWLTVQGIIMLFVSSVNADAATLQWASRRTPPSCLTTRRYPHPE